ncbi:MAG: 50S ribosomal protein L19 [Patescibacteria group bacterium]|jgi:large subunit ribosomal protein L19
MDQKTEPIEETTSEVIESTSVDNVTVEVSPKVKEATLSYVAVKDRIFAEVVPGALIRVHQKIREMTPKGEEKERVQVFEGTVIARRHGSEGGATITVRKISDGVGVEKIFPLHMPTIVKIEVKKLFHARRAKLGYLRTSKKRLREIRTVSSRTA